MRMARIPAADIRTQHVPLKGGIDLATPMMLLEPGNALEAMNYEPGLMGGYKRIDGFERVDGRPAPSAAIYTYLEGVLPPLAFGTTVTGAVSGATGVTVKFDNLLGHLSVSKVVGEFVAGEDIRVNGQIVGTLSLDGAPRGYRDAKGDAEAMAAAADLYRADILEVPGAGPVRGVWMHQGVLYAFRDNLANTECVMHKATPAGWQAIALGEEIAFSNANDSVKEGAVLTQGTGGAQSAMIARVVLETGTLQSGTNTGRLILKNRTGTTFATGAATTTGQGAGTLTLGGAQQAITMLPGGRFEFASENMGGATATYRMYGCDGKNRAFEFDGSVFAPISTGAAKDAPSYLIVHKQRLFLAIEASLQWSGDGNPYVWTTTLGAGVAGMGDNITGLAVQAGDALGIFSRNSSSQLQGNTVNNFQMLPISAEIGALAYSVQTIGKTYGMDDRGLVATDRTQAFGNFIQSTISTRVQQLVDRLRSRVVGSVVYRNRNQYRVFGADGSGLIATFGESGLLGITELKYPVKPTCFASCEDASGSDAVFFGADNGYVYRADVGSSFDGESIEAYLRLPFNHVGGPRIRKRFRKAVLELAASGYTAIRVQPEFSYGDPDVGTHRLQTGEITGGGGHWDTSDWESFYYDAQLVSSPSFSIEGTGLNMAMLLYTDSAIDYGHTLQGMLIHFSPRRLER